jgi:DNA repair protein RadA/Sms
MAKAKTAFVCNECGADYAKWQGQCQACNAWNSLSEIRLTSGKTSARVSAAQDPRYQGYAGAITGIQNLSDIDLGDVPRFSSGANEFDRVLGGGLVPGGVVLIGGSPGAGKSTLLLQTMCWLAEQQSALYVTGEESLQQVAMRAQRLGLPTQNLKMLSETNVEAILTIAQQVKPKVMVIDSIQVMHLDGVESAPGSVSKVR